MLGIKRGGDDGHGHLGYVSVTGLQPFGTDVFNQALGDSAGIAYTFVQ